MTLDVKAAIVAHREAVDCVLAMESALLKAAERLQQTFASGQRVYACGNGGSAADAQHFAAELTGRYDRDRRGYPAIALTTDTSALTSIGNDYGYDAIFSRQLESLAVPGDLLIAISTSGNSANVIKAVEHARANGIYTIGLLGRDGGRLAERVDLPLTVSVQKTGRIQEAHILILHLLCEAFEP
jgi:D-sedoheptulose 7-phosphate isomerase